QFKLDIGIKVEIGSIDGFKNNEIVIFDQNIIEKALSNKIPIYVVKEAECKIGMMGDFSNLLNLEDVTKLVDPSNDNELTRTEALNSLLENDEWVEQHKDVLTVIGY